jgi:hypothetical protein
MDGRKAAELVAIIASAIPVKNQRSTAECFCTCDRLSNSFVDMQSSRLSKSGGLAKHTRNCEPADLGKTLTLK